MFRVQFGNGDTPRCAGSPLPRPPRFPSHAIKASEGTLLESPRKGVSGVKARTKHDVGSVLEFGLLVAWFISGCLSELFERFS